MDSSKRPRNGNAVSNGELKRETFQTSRLFDFASEKELVAQTGHDSDDWPLVILKESIDNALDACEEAGAAPVIRVAVNEQGITIADNGPGIPSSTIDGVLDFSVRVSSREAYVSPTRGAQGNALKTIVAMPFVLNGDHGRIDISAHGQCHEIVFAVDRIRQEPRIDREIRQSAVRNGTVLTVHWPDKARSLLTDADQRFLQLADDYCFLNPHLALEVDWFGSMTSTEATTPDWKKWLPSEPTSPHWYGQEEIERLISAYIAHDQDRGADRSVRELVKEFRGLSGTAKQKAVLEETGLARTALSGLVNGEGLHHATVAKLLESMRKHSKPVKPAMLGTIGRDHVAGRFQSLGCQMESFRYDKRVEVDDDGLPTIIESAFGWRPDSEAPRRIVTGVNWSPGVRNPFRTLGDEYGDGLAALLENLRAGSDEPIVFLLHCTCPRVRYTDRGKSALVVEKADGILKSIEAVTKVWTKQRKREERGLARSRLEAMTCRSHKVSVKDAEFQVIPQGYLKASGGNKYPTKVRQVYYAARRDAARIAGVPVEKITFSYFSTILRQYMAAHPKETASWDVVYDARGNCAEPHTKSIVPLGTLEVREYVRNAQDHSVRPVGSMKLHDEYPTCGPENRFRAVLFVEKEGFDPLFKAAHIAERYDLAIMSSKGMPVVACRQLADELCGPAKIPLLVLRDFDKAGFSIMGTLMGLEKYDRYDNPIESRYEYQHEFPIIDLGLRLEDVKRCKLESEPVVYAKGDPSENLAANGATREEIAFLFHHSDRWSREGQRVELNAFTSDQFIAWLEKKLRLHGIGKVMPQNEVLDRQYRRALQIKLINEDLPAMIRRAQGIAAQAKVPKDLAGVIRRRWKTASELSWDRVVADIAAANCKERGKAKTSREQEE